LKHFKFSKSGAYHPSKQHPDLILSAPVPIFRFSRLIVETNKTLHIDDIDDSPSTWSTAYCKASLVDTNTEVILKVFMSCDRQEDLYHRLEEEVKSMNSLRHSRIVNFIGCCLDLSTNVKNVQTRTSGNQVALVFEHLERGDLHSLLAGDVSALSVSEKLEIAKDVSEAMSFLHSMSVYGCGLRSRRVMVDDKGRVKIFLVSPLDQSSCTNAATRDIHDFGQLLYEMLTGKQPIIYGGIKKHKRGNKKFQESFLLLNGEVSKKYPPKLIELMHECLQLPSAGKLLSFLDINQRLQVLLEELETQKRVHEKAIPDGFICPITQDIMRDPVILVFDGHSYERKAIEDWLKRSNRSPLTNEVLPEGYGGIVLVENYALKSAIASYHNTDTVNGTCKV
jgi:serine/threonine protein kinase